MPKNRKNILPVKRARRIVLRSFGKNNRENSNEMGCSMLVSLIRTVILYIVVTACVRLMGKRQVGELQNSELVITLLISELAAIPMGETGTPLLNGIVPIFALVICEILVSVAMMKCRGFRTLMCGNPVVLIEHGKLRQKQMSRLRFTVEDLSEALRLEGVFDLSEVEFAAMETNGRLSVLRKDETRPPDEKTLAVVVINDGKFCAHSAEICGCTRAWVQQVLQKEQCAMEDIFLMTVDTKGHYHLLKKEQ